MIVKGIPKSMTQFEVIVTIVFFIFTYIDFRIVLWENIVTLVTCINLQTCNSTLYSIFLYPRF